jgi:anti-anti-sigma factor
VRSAQSSLSVDVQADEPDRTSVRLRLDGELDITSSPLLQTVVEQVLQTRRDPPCNRLTVDMSGVGFADASGIWPLLLARATLRRRGGHIELRHCRRNVLRLLRLLDLGDLAYLEDAG